MNETEEKTEEKTFEGLGLELNVNPEALNGQVTIEFYDYEIELEIETNTTTEVNGTAMNGAYDSDNYTVNVDLEESFELEDSSLSEVIISGEELVRIVRKFKGEYRELFLKAIGAAEPGRLPRPAPATMAEPIQKKETVGAPWLQEMQEVLDRGKRDVGFVPPEGMYDFKVDMLQQMVDRVNTTLDHGQGLTVVAERVWLKAQHCYDQIRNLFLVS